LIEFVGTLAGRACAMNAARALTVHEFPGNLRRSSYL